MQSDAISSDQTPVAPRASTLAITSLVLGLISVPLGILTGIPAAICGHISLSKIKKGAGTLTGRRMAVAGIILGYFFFVVQGFVSGAFSPLFEDRAKIRFYRVAADIQAIRTQLGLYRSMNGFFPTTAQTLQALVGQPTSSPVPARWMQSLYELPRDPWDHTYVYFCPGRKNPNGYDLYSVGPDGKPDTPDDIWINE